MLASFLDEFYVSGYQVRPTLMQYNTFALQNELFNHVYVCMTDVPQVNSMSGTHISSATFAHHLDSTSTLY